MDFTYTSKEICFYSFNSRGFHEDKQDICKILTLKNDSNLPILCNQENFLLQNNCYKVRQCFTDSQIFFKRVVMESTYGRPKNGLLPFLKKSKRMLKIYHNTNKFDHVVWAGDLNADFHRNTKFSLIIDQFIKERYLLRPWDKFEVDFYACC